MKHFTTTCVFYKGGGAYDFVEKIFLLCISNCLSKFKIVKEMKNASFSKVSFVLALLLGLATAWSAITPTELPTSSEVGGCFKCVGCVNSFCPLGCSGPGIGIGCMMTDGYMGRGSCKWGGTAGSSCDGPYPRCSVRFCLGCTSD